MTPEQRKQHDERVRKCIMGFGVHLVVDKDNAFFAVFPDSIEGEEKAQALVNYMNEGQLSKTCPLRTFPMRFTEWKLT